MTATTKIRKAQVIETTENVKPKSVLSVSTWIQTTYFRLFTAALEG